MIDERREAQASLYVLGALPPDELREFEAVLERDRQLQVLVRELRGTTGALVAAFPRVAPPAHLKQKILDAVTPRPSGPIPLPENDTSSWLFWVPWALAACFAILCVLLISVGHSLRKQAVQLQDRLTTESDELAALRDQLDQTESNAAQVVTNYQTRINEIQRQVLQRVEELTRQNAALTNQLNQQHSETRRQLASTRDRADSLAREKKALEEALAAVTVPDTDRLSATRLSVLRPTATGPAGTIGASVWSGQDQRGVLVLENLPPLPANQTYQFWLIDPKLAIPISGGVLPPGSGSVRFNFAPLIRVDSAERFAISVEPVGGSATPTPGRIVMASN